VGFRDEYPKIEAANGVVIGVSPDPPDRLQKFRAKNDLPFLLLSDPDHRVADMYGVWGEKKMYGKTFMGIIRSHFVIDEEGRVVDAQVKVSPQESVELAVAALSDRAHLRAGLPPGYLRFGSSAGGRLLSLVEARLDKEAAIRYNIAKLAILTIT